MTAKKARRSRFGPRSVVVVPMRHNASAVVTRRKLPVSVTTLAVVLAVLIVVHLYIGWRLWPGFDTSPWTLGGLVGALCLTLLAIPLSMFTRAIHRQPLADRLAWGGFLIMGFFSSLFVLTLARDLLIAAITLLNVDALTSMKALVQSARAVPVLAVLATLVGYANARRLPSVVEVRVPIRDLPPPFEGLTLAQISDLHVGPTIKSDYVRRVVERTNGLKADIITVTGDVVDGRVSDLAPHTAPLGELAAPLGVFAVTGNHEYYSGADAWVEEYRRLGLRVLMNEHVVIEREGARLVVAGVTDYTAHHFDTAQRSDPQASLAGAPQAQAKLLLAHQPLSADAAARAGFHLQLSGHTHGGQFWPWNLFVPLQQPYTAGLHKHGDLWVYISRGTGYWGPPKRLGAPSEITHLRLTRAA